MLQIVLKKEETKRQRDRHSPLPFNETIINHNDRTVIDGSRLAERLLLQNCFAITQLLLSLRVFGVDLRRIYPLQALRGGGIGSINYHNDAQKKTR